MFARFYALFLATAILAFIAFVPYLAKTIEIENKKQENEPLTMPTKKDNILCVLTIIGIIIFAIIAVSGAVYLIDNHIVPDI
jgi:hypothetical protein